MYNVASSSQSPILALFQRFLWIGLVCGYYSMDEILRQYRKLSRKCENYVFRHLNATERTSKYALKHLLVLYVFCSLSYNV